MKFATPILPILKTMLVSGSFFLVSGLLPVLGPLEQYMTPTLDAALLSSSRAGADLGRTLALQLGICN